MKNLISVDTANNANVKTEMPGVVDNVMEYIQLYAKNLDKETIAKYVGLALLVIYGVRKSNLVGSLILSVVTGLVTKLVSEKLASQDSSLKNSDL